jgi:8-amino-7-oxononanoate synthase
VHSDSESLLDLAGNDYLGLARDPRVVAGAVAAARSYGAGAAFTGFPSALEFSTGYHANLSVVCALAGPDTLIVSDAHIHASMIDACRLARASVTVTPHNDVAAGAGPGRDDLFRPRRRRANSGAGRTCRSQRCGAHRR